MEKIKRGLTAVGAFLADRMKLDRLEKGKPGLWRDLTSLSAGSKTAVKSYYIRKISMFLGVLSAGAVLSVICFFCFAGEEQEETVRSLARPGYGEGDRKEALTVRMEGETEEQRIEVRVQERVYTDQEKENLLSRAAEELDTLLLGENESLDEVRKALVLPAELEGGAVRVSWLTIPYGVIDESGKLTGADKEDGILVELQGTLTCGGQEAVYTAYANVFPPKVEEQERIRQGILKEAELADARESHEESLQLPRTFEGKQLTWKQERENPFLSVLLLSVILAVGVCFEMDSRVHEKAEERRKQLLLDYPDLMWKMTMLLGAGLGIRGTFARISEEYLRDRKLGSRDFRYVYEEVTYTCFEMQSGISEAQAYERFGKRCQLPEYIRLGTVLSQNLRKGAKGLTAMLEMEAESSLTDRKNHARKIGERAGTRLLLPMVLMLGIVLVILMVPAFLSF